MRPLPDDVLEVIEDLEAHYPPRCKALDETVEEHARYAGAVDLIDTLRQRYDWTRKNAKVTDI